MKIEILRILFPKTRFKNYLLYEYRLFKPPENICLIDFGLITLKVRS